MKKNYCDRCGKELNGHEGRFIKFAKTYKVFWINWDVFHKTNKGCFDEEELCKDCFYEFLKIYDDFWKQKKK